VTDGRYGKLTVVSVVGKAHAARAICRCDCGVEKTYIVRHLRSGAIRQCGCESDAPTWKWTPPEKTPEKVVALVPSPLYWVPAQGMKQCGGLTSCGEWKALDEFGMNWHHHRTPVMMVLLLQNWPSSLA
jgi:hypothetical protein